MSPPGNCRWRAARESALGHLGQVLGCHELLAYPNEAGFSKRDEIMALLAGRWAEATAELERAASLMPDDARVRRNLDAVRQRMAR